MHLSELISYSTRIVFFFKILNTKQQYALHNIIEKIYVH